MRGKSLLAGAVAASAATLVLVWQVQASSDEPSDNGSDMSVVQQSGPDLIELVRKGLGDEFGGGWIATGPGGDVVHIGVTNESPDVLEQVTVSASTLGLLGRVQIDTVKYSHQQLADFYDTLGGIARTTEGVIGWGVQVDQNRVQLILSEPQEGLADRIGALLPEDSFVITVDPGSALVAS